MAFWVQSSICQFCGEEHTWFCHSMPFASSDEWNRCVARTLLLRAMVRRHGQLGGDVREVRAEDEVFSSLVEEVA